MKCTFIFSNIFSAKEKQNISIWNETEQLTVPVLDHLRSATASACLGIGVKPGTGVDPRSPTDRYPRQAQQYYPILWRRMGRSIIVLSPAASDCCWTLVPSCFLPITYCGFWDILGFWNNVVVFLIGCWGHRGRVSISRCLYGLFKTQPLVLGFCTGRRKGNWTQIFCYCCKLLEFFHFQYF